MISFKFLVKFYKLKTFARTERFPSFPYSLYLKAKLLPYKIRYIVTFNCDTLKNIPCAYEHQSCDVIDDLEIVDEGLQSMMAISVMETPQGEERMNTFHTMKIYNQMCSTNL